MVQYIYTLGAAGERLDIAELDFEGNVRAYYTIGADLISQELGGRTYTYLYDGHGSVVGLMSEDGTVTDTYTYDAFGNLLKSTGRTANNYRYCGEQFDSTTGLYYLRARYMDTSTGRFISQDSYAGSVYDPASLHKYLYCNSDPVNNVDPSGYMTRAELDTSVVINSVLDAAYEMATASVLALGISLISSLKTVAITHMAEVEISVSQLEMLIHMGFVGFASTIYMESVLETVEFSFSVIRDYVKQRLNEKGDKYPGQYELHHIVARLHPRAAVARAILNVVDIGIDEECNTVLLKKAVHKFLHRKIYFSFVNVTIGLAYTDAVKKDRDEKTEVLIALSYLKVSLLGLNTLC